jgi:hypothetical protein
MFFSFSYMIAFLIANYAVLQERYYSGRSANLGIITFIELFVYAVNCPSLVAFVSIFFVYHFILGESSVHDRELFLSGATACIYFERIFRMR